MDYLFELLDNIEKKRRNNIAPFLNLKQKLKQAQVVQQYFIPSPEESNNTL